MILTKVLLKVKKYITILKLKKVYCKISKSSNIANCTFEGSNNIGKKTIVSNSYIGKFSFIGTNCVLPKVKIGRYCSISGNVEIISGTHPSKTFVSTSPLFYNTVNKLIKLFSDVPFKEYHYADEDNKYLCMIGNDVWIGYNVKIMQGIKIGNGAILGANALITKDVPNFAIVGGVPAKVIKYRFNEEQIEFLEKLKWWNKDINWIKENAKLFSNIESMMEKLINPMEE